MNFNDYTTMTIHYSTIVMYLGTSCLININNKLICAHYLNIFL